MVGTVQAIWRYPVKSMLGEALDQVEIVAGGLLGDRAYALWDKATERVASAKNPKKWANLLNFQAHFTAPPQSLADLPPVAVTCPDGQTLRSDAGATNRHLSAVLARDVEMISAPPPQVSLDQYWPDVEGTPQRDVVTQLMMPEGTFFDSCPIHLITTSTLRRLQALYPEGTMDFCRFRPNIIIDMPAEGFVENDWVGQELLIGDQVRLRIDTACPRCVVTTLAQQGLPQDLEILRTTVRHNNLIAGIRASVLQTGAIATGDQIRLA